MCLLLSSVLEGFSRLAFGDPQAAKKLIWDEAMAVVFLE